MCAGYVLDILSRYRTQSPFFLLPFFHTGEAASWSWRVFNQRGLPSLVNLTCNKNSLTKFLIHGISWFINRQAPQHLSFALVLDFTFAQRPKLSEKVTFHQHGLVVLRIPHAIVYESWLCMYGQILLSSLIKLIFFALKKPQCLEWALQEKLYFNKLNKKAKYNKNCI